MKNIRKIIRKLIFEETSRLGVIKEMPFWLNREKISGLAPGETVGNHFQKLKDEQEKEFEDFQKKEKERSVSIADSRIKMLSKNVNLDKKGYDIMHAYFKDSGSNNSANRIYKSDSHIGSILYFREDDGFYEENPSVAVIIRWYKEKPGGLFPTKDISEYYYKEGRSKSD